MSTSIELKREVGLPTRGQRLGTAALGYYLCAHTSRRCRRTLASLLVRVHFREVLALVARDVGEVRVPDAGVRDPAIESGETGGLRAGRLLIGQALFERVDELAALLRREASGLLQDLVNASLRISVTRSIAMVSLPSTLRADLL